MGNLLYAGVGSSNLARSPSWGPDRADHRLTARMDMDMLDGDLLLSLSAVPIERIEKHCKASRELVSLVQILCRPSNVCSPIIARRYIPSPRYELQLTAQPSFIPTHFTD